MQSTLADRLREALDGPPKLTSAALAKACNVKPPSVSDWLSGKSRSMDGGNLIDAADFLNVRPKWLIKGIGPKRYNPFDPRHLAEDSDHPDLAPKPILDPWVNEANNLLMRLDASDRRAAVLLLRTFVAQLGPPRTS